MDNNSYRLPYEAPRSESFQIRPRHTVLLGSPGGNNENENEGTQILVPEGEGEP